MLLLEIFSNGLLDQGTCHRLGLERRSSASFCTSVHHLADVDPQLQRVTWLLLYLFTWMEKVT